jgi:hypothetical protein
MSKKPYKLQEWDKLFTNAPYEKHLDLLIVLGIIYRSSEGEEALRNIDLSGDSVILSRLMGHNESFAEAFDGIDVERLFYTYFSDKKYEEMLFEEWGLDIWAKTGLDNHNFLSKWKDLFKLFPISQDLKKELPDGNFTIYRAGSPEGISWTTNRGIAMWFWSKNKLLNSEPRYNRFLSLSVTKEDVLFYNNKKGQNEVVLIPNEIKVKIIPYKEFQNYKQIKPEYGF